MFDYNFNLIIPTVTRPLIAFPFDYVIIKKQLSDKHLSYKNIILNSKDNTNTKLLKFLKIHFLELVLKSNVYSMYYYTKKYANTFDISKKYNYIPELFSTLCISLTDILIINPFERIKVSIIKNYDIKKNMNVRWLFDGSTLTFTTSFIHIGTFLTLNNINKKYLFDEKKKLNFIDTVKLGTVTSIFQSLFTYPFLTLRTRFQDTNLLKKISLSKFLSDKSNYKYLYNGLMSRFARSFIIVILDTYWINNL